MKGTTILQIIDGDTGKILNEVKEENYITSFFDSYQKKLFEYPSVVIKQSVSQRFLEFAQGVVLFQNVMPSSGCILPRDSDVFTGYASDIYSGADLKRGSLNNLESGPLTRGVRKVWDFGTGIAVGEIAAVSLTTANGGKFDRDMSGALEMSKNIHASWAAGSNPNGYAVAELTKSHILYSYGDLYGGGQFDWGDFWWTRAFSNKVQYNISRLLTISSDKNVSDIDRIINPALQATPVGYTRCANPTMDSNYFLVLFYKAATGFKIHRYSLTTGLFVDELTYSLTYNKAPIKFKVYGNKIIWVNGQSVETYDISTYNQTYNATAAPRGIIAFCESKTVPDTIVLYLTLSSGSLVDYATMYFNYANDAKFNYVLNQQDPTSIYSRAPYQTPSGKCAIYVDEPFYMLSLGSGGYQSNYTVQSQLYDFVSPRVLSTINNLSSPITKASGQVLKVIYDITW